jgi:WD repeat-containing protein 70
MSVDNSRSEDPREALLKMDEAAKKDPIFLGKAYSQTQPEKQLHQQTFEQEQEEFKKKQKKL